MRNSLRSYEAGPCPVHHARRGEERRRRHRHGHRPVMHRFRSRQQSQPVPPPRCVLPKPGRKRLEIRQRSRDAPIGRSGHRCESGPSTSAIRRAGIFGIAVAADTRGQGPRFGIARSRRTAKRPPRNGEVGCPGSALFADDAVSVPIPHERIGGMPALHRSGAVSSGFLAGNAFVAVVVP